jgi:dihydropteroate synthase
VERKLRARDRVLDLSGPALVMGILNVTPDSFFDGGRYAGVDGARARAAEMVALGATIVDIGGRSYSRKNPPVDPSEEIARVVPVVEALVRDGLPAALSIDTTRPAVAAAALAAGAHIINDCSGLADASLASVVARYDAGLVVMHIKGALNVRAASYEYADALGEIVTFLRDRTETAVAAGVARDAIVVDPGLEFGKEAHTDLELLARFAEFGTLGYPALLAASRKTFLGEVVGRASATDLLAASLAVAAVGIAAGARIVRAHDVAETLDVARVMAAVAAAEPTGTARV